MEFLCFLFFVVVVFFLEGGGEVGALLLKTHLGESFPARARRVRRTAELAAGKLLHILKG